MKRVWVLFLVVFIIICIFSIPVIEKNISLRANVEVDNALGFMNQTIYLKDRYGYLVEVDAFIDPIQLIPGIFSYLKESNQNMISSFNGYIPDNVQLLDYHLLDGILYLNISSDFLQIEEKKFIISGIVHSYLKLPDVLKISIQVDSQELSGFPSFFDQSYPINEEDDFLNRRNISKVVVFYEEIDSNMNYFLPVTKYLNDDREKIEIIIDHLKDNIPSSLVSVLPIHTELLNYEIDNNVMILNFNDSIKKNMDENFRLISSSVFFNYDVSSVIFQVDGEIEKYVSLIA